MYGKHLKQWRITFKLTQKELAEKINVSQQIISFHESGRSIPSIEICEKLADFYEITLDELIGRDERFTLSN